MKERQRWQAEEDTVLRDYVKQYGPRDWHLVSQRMGTLLDRDAKSCVERWKNYLKPGIKKGPLSDEEQQLVISLQAKYGNKWKKIAAEVPGRTAKRLGKWWEVYKEKQQKEKEKDRPRCSGAANSNEGTSTYSDMLANLADKFGHRPLVTAAMPPFPIPTLLGPPAITVPLPLLGTPERPDAGQSAVGILTSNHPSLDTPTPLPLATLAVPVSVMTTAIGSWLSSAISVSKSTELDVKPVPMEISAVAEGSEAHPATFASAKTTQGHFLGPAEDGKTASVLRDVAAQETSQPSASGGSSSSLPAWMSNVPVSAAQLAGVGSDRGQTIIPLPPPSSGGVSAIGARGCSNVSLQNLELAVSLTMASATTGTAAPGVAVSDTYVLAQRGWLQSAMSRTEAGPQDTIGDATGSTVQPIWSSSNPQTTGQKSVGPDLMLSRSSPAPDMASSSSHWLKILDCCRELEEGRQYWYTQRKESTWRLNRLEAKLESEKMQRWKQKMEEVEASILSLRAEECRFLEELEADYKEKLLSLHREEEQKDAKLAEMWTARHTQLMHFLELMHQPPPPQMAHPHSGAGPSDKP